MFKVYKIKYNDIFQIDKINPSRNLFPWPILWLSIVDLVCRILFLFHTVWQSYLHLGLLNHLYANNQNLISIPDISFEY